MGCTSNNKLLLANKVIEGSELRVELEGEQQQHRAAMAAAKAAADDRLAAKDIEIASLQSELSSRQLLREAAEDRVADYQKQSTALQQRLDQASIAMQQAKLQSEDFERERQAWAQEREDLRQGLETAKAAGSEHLQKLLTCEEDTQKQMQRLQLLQLELQHQQDATTHAQHELQVKAEQARAWDAFVILLAPFLDPLVVTSKLCIQQRGSCSRTALLCSLLAT